MATELNTALKFDAITAICVVETEVAAVEVFGELGRCLGNLAHDHEIVVIANGLDAASTLRLREITNAVGNVTVHFLAQRIDSDSGVLLGIDQALGDWIVVLTPTMEEVASLPRLLGRVGTYEVVFAGTRNTDQIPNWYQVLARAYFRFYDVLSGSKSEWPSPRVRIYSRPAARYIASLLDGEFALRSLQMSGAFPGTREIIDSSPSDSVHVRDKGSAVRKALGGLLNSAGMPLRIVVGVALLTAGFSVFTSIYAVLTYLFKENVAPGWTTLSLLISIMMLLFSMMFALMAEYVLNVYRAMSPRRRTNIVREMRSPRQQASRLNVLSEKPHLGKPAEDMQAVGPEGAR